MKKIEVQQPESEPFSIRVKRGVGKVATYAAIGAAPLIIVGEADEPLRAKGVQSVEAETLEDALKDNTEGMGDNGVGATEASRYVADQLGEEVMDQANTTGVFNVPESIESIDNDLIPFEQSEDWEFNSESKE